MALVCSSKPYLFEYVLPNLTPVAVYGAIIAGHQTLGPHNSNYDPRYSWIHLHIYHYGYYVSLFVQ